MRDYYVDANEQQQHSPAPSSTSPSALQVEDARFKAQVFEWNVIEYSVTPKGKGKQNILRNIGEYTVALI